MYNSLFIDGVKEMFDLVWTVPRALNKHSEPGALNGPPRLRVQSRSRMQFRIATSSAFRFVLVLKRLETL